MLPQLRVLDSKPVTQSKQEEDQPKPNKTEKHKLTTDEQTPSKKQKLVQQKPNQISSKKEATESKKSKMEVSQFKKIPEGEESLKISNEDPEKLGSKSTGVRKVKLVKKKTQKINPAQLVQKDEEMLPTWDWKPSCYVFTVYPNHAKPTASLTLGAFATSLDIASFRVQNRHSIHSDAYGYCDQ